MVTGWRIVKVNWISQNLQNWHDSLFGPCFVASSSLSVPPFTWFINSQFGLRAFCLLTCLQNALYQGAQTCSYACHRSQKGSFTNSILAIKIIIPYSSVLQRSQSGLGLHFCRVRWSYEAERRWCHTAITEQIRTRWCKGALCWDDSRRSAGLNILTAFMAVLLLKGSMCFKFAYILWDVRVAIGSKGVICLVITFRHSPVTTVCLASSGEM